MQQSLPVVTSLLKETHVWNKALCLYFSFLCFPGGKWQMSGSRVGFECALKPCCYILEVLPRYLARHLPRHSAEKSDIYSALDVS